jgi:hypothetical protein
LLYTSFFRRAGTFSGWAVHPAFVERRFCEALQRSWDNELDGTLERDPECTQYVLGTSGGSSGHAEFIRLLESFRTTSDHDVERQAPQTKG